MGSMQPCPAMQGWRDIGSPQCHDQTSNPGEDPTSCREKKSSKLQEAKTEQAFLGSWIPTANHKIRLIEDLTWIFHCVTFFSLVWISPAPSLIFFELPQLAFLPKLSKTPSRSPLSSIFFFLFLAFFPRSGNLAPAPLFPAPYSRLRIAPSPSFHFQPASGG